MFLGIKISFYDYHNYVHILHLLIMIINLLTFNNRTQVDNISGSNSNVTATREEREKELFDRSNLFTTFHF